MEKNIENENMEKAYNVYARMQELVKKDGPIWLWDAKDFEKGGSFIFTFATKEDALEYARLRNERRQGAGNGAMEFTVGTEEEYLQAAMEYSRQKKANEVKAYQKHVDGKIKREEHEIKALEALKGVCREFDGKVINKRFHDAVKDATGYYNSFRSYNYELECYGTEFQEIPTIHISADWSHGYNTLTGVKKEMKATDWQWCTGDRLEAEKAVIVIDNVINQRLQKVESLKATKKQYSEYLKKARKAEELLKELEGYDYEIRNYAMEHDLSRYVHSKCIWK